MLSPRTETILKSIVGQYITSAVPVSSQSITTKSELGVSPATIRNEMAHLEQEGYITRPHISAGSIPLDKGYRCYVESIGNVRLPVTEQRLISHLFHQVERELDDWLYLAATLVAQKVQNVAIVTMPKTDVCQFKYLEVVCLQDYLALLVLVLDGAKVRQQLITFNEIISQSELRIAASRLSDIYSGLTRVQISNKSSGLSSVEQQITDCLLKLMEAEDSRKYEESYLDGLHFTLNQPEFVHNHWLALRLMELVEQRNLIKNIIPSRLKNKGVQVIIGKENESENIHDYSVVISRYGIPGEAVGTIGVVGPTRMPYTRTIATVDYLSLVLSVLVAKLYGREVPVTIDFDISD